MDATGYRVAPKICAQTPLSLRTIAFVELWFFGIDKRFHVNHDSTYFRKDLLNRGLYSAPQRVGVVQ